MGGETEESFERRAVEAGAVAFVRRHFDLLNQGDLESAKVQLYFPSGLDRRPLDVYVQSMKALSPFKAVVLSVAQFEDCRDTRHGLRAAAKVDVTVQCALGIRSSDFTVWWFPKRNEYLIATKPTEWVLELRIGKSR